MARMHGEDSMNLSAAAGAGAPKHHLKGHCLRYDPQPRALVS
jgi:hypothetical protein